MPCASFAELVAVAQAGDRVISFPTDTVPGLAVRPERAELIFQLKQRQLDKPLILMGASLDDLWPFVRGTEAERETWQQVTEQFWPGALTLVLPASDRVPAAIHPNDLTTIGVRVPNHPIALKILAQTGPLATTSANLSGQPALETMPAIAAQFPEVMMLAEAELVQLGFSPTSDNKALASGVPSTVAKWTGSTWQVLRQGAIQLT
jgi:L-threonylcarbamoyladenylate synthase